MSKTKFRAADIARAVKGARAAGLDVGSVRIQPDGCIEILTNAVQAESNDEAEKWFADNARAPDGH